MDINKISTPYRLRNNRDTAGNIATSSSSLISSSGSSWLENYIKYDAEKNLLLFSPSVASEGEITAWSLGNGNPSLWDSMPIATTSILGGIIVGDGLTIDSSGILSTDVQEQSIQTLTFANNILSISEGNSVDLSTLETDLTGYAKEAWSLENFHPLNGLGTLDFNANNLSLNGNLTVNGNIIQTGTTYSTHAEQVFTTSNLIILRDGAISGLGTGEYVGIKAKLYDGVNDGSLVFDKNGIARVGDLGNEQPLATREEIPLNNGFSYWDSSENRFKTKTISSVNLTDGSTLSRVGHTHNYLSLDGGTINGDLHIDGNLTASGEIAAYITQSIESNIFDSLSVNAPLTKEGSLLGLGYNNSHFELINNNLSIKPTYLNSTVNEHIGNNNIHFTMDEISENHYNKVQSDNRYILSPQSTSLKGHILVSDGSKGVWERKPYVNVKEFGAKGDGVTNDYSAIIEAINSLPVTGGTIYFPIGDYLINSLIAIQNKQNISFVGDNLNSKIIAKGYNGRHFNFSDCDSIIFKNIRMIGDGMNSYNSVGGIRFQLDVNSNTAYNVFENVVVEEVTNSAIVMDTPIQCNFKNVLARLVVGHGFDMWNGGTSLYFETCFALTCTKAGYMIDTISYSSLSGCAADVCGVGYCFRNSKAISLLGCGSEASIHRTEDYNGSGWKLYNGSVVTAISCYERGSVQEFNIEEGSVLDKINFKASASTHVTSLKGLDKEYLSLTGGTINGFVTINNNILEIIAPDNYADGLVMKFPSGSTGARTNILFKGNDGSYNINYAGIRAGVESWSKDNGYLGFRTSRTTTLAEKMRLTSNGSLEVGYNYTGTSNDLENGFIVQGLAGFGKNNPTQAIDVAGNGIFSGSVTASSFIGNLSGNANTANELSTGRIISLSGDLSGAVSFNGSENVVLSASVKDDSHNHIISNIDGLQTALNSKLNSSTYTASNVLSKIKTVDGSGSGLDADLLDGIGSTGFFRYRGSIDPDLLKSSGNFIRGAGLSGNPFGGTGASGFASFESDSYGWQLLGADGGAFRIKGRILSNGVFSDWVDIYHSGNSNKSTVNWSTKNLTANGTITASGEITAYSDRRLKDNIEPLNSQLEKVVQLNPVSYTKDNKQSIGFIAQELKEVYPEFVVGEEKNDEYLSVNYQQMVASLTKAIQEQQKQIIQLQKQLNQLTNDITK